MLPPEHVIVIVVVVIIIIIIIIITIIIIIITNLIIDRGKDDMVISINLLELAVELQNPTNQDLLLRLDHLDFMVLMPKIRIMV